MYILPQSLEESSFTYSIPKDTIPVVKVQPQHVYNLVTHLVVCRVQVERAQVPDSFPTTTQVDR